MEPTIIGKLSHNLYGTEYDNLQVIRANYQTPGNPMAIALVEEDETPFCTLSVNLPDSSYTLKEGEFFAKTWSENELVAEAALKSGLFVDTGIRVPTGWVEAQVWKLA